ncbi:MAG: HAD hydrolase family protein [Gemmatimonadota bacterium]|nr:HAD hydrolase family protein [Gemmatimonadota bacterium]MDH5804138.1 HAD hydrolase family protein [Gemmatimonadota bacterium]
MLDPAIARKIKLVGLDVDGVMTDAGVYIGSAGTHPVELKRFDVQDNVGVHLLKEAGLIVAVASGRYSEATSIRSKELGIVDVYQDTGGYKLKGFVQIVQKYGVGWDEVAFLGDDLPDFPVLGKVGLPVAVANAVPEIKEISRLVTEKPGGHGAIREFAEILLKARGEWDSVLEAYFSERSEEVFEANV